MIFISNDDTRVLSKVLRHFRKMNVQVTRHLNLSHLNNLFSLCENNQLSNQAGKIALGVFDD